jgi:phosphoribosylaminoimidazole-succinocarboxamide synthase
MQTSPQTSIELPGIKKLRSGKVREVFDLGDTLLFVATDRISAFDVILPDPIPHKGAVLNQISRITLLRWTSKSSRRNCSHSASSLPDAR